jgi:hypothetical protein
MSDELVRRLQEAAAELSLVVYNVDGIHITAIEEAAALIEQQARTIAARPIETAPRDGTHIIGRTKSQGWVEMWWEEVEPGVFNWMDEADSEPEPTHWIPCPQGSP